MRRHEKSGDSSTFLVVNFDDRHHGNHGNHDEDLGFGNDGTNSLQSRLDWDDHKFEDPENGTLSELAP